jgi:hypothetical protein
MYSLKNYLRLPLERKVDHVIELTPRVAQIKDLLEKGYI